MNIPDPYIQPHVVILGAGASLAAFPNGDKSGKRLPLMNNLVEVVGLEPELQAMGISEPVNNFEALFDTLSSEFLGNPHLEIIKEKIYSYFRSLQLPEQITLYDQLVLSLREKDIIATFNWDPFLALAFQRNMHLKRLPNLVFLHGNVFVGICLDHHTIGFTNCACTKCGKRFKPVNLLYPVRNKDYTQDAFIALQWDILRAYLKNAFIITIFGYSAPQTDAAAREIMSEVWQSNITQTMSEINVVDIKDKKKVENNWSDFFVKGHYCIYRNVQDAYLLRHPRRSCEAFGSTILNNNPWSEPQISQTNSLQDYQDWIQTLMEKEDANNSNHWDFLNPW